MPCAGFGLWLWFEMRKMSSSTWILMSSGLSPFCIRLKCIENEKPVMASTLPSASMGSRTGNPTFSIFTDYGTSDSNAAALSLGATTGDALHRKSYRGIDFSYKLSASSGLWTATRLGYEISAVRLPGVRST